MYSLGRLLRFILTGRHPDSSERCPCGLVVATATLHDPSRRYNSVADLLRALDELAELETAHTTAFDLGSLNSESPTHDWRVVHEAAVSGAYQGHVFYGYLAPLTLYFMAEGRLEEFRAAAGPAFIPFVERYVEHMERCLALTGWPFRAMESFGELLYRIGARSQSHEVKLVAMIGLWNLAYEHDQWSAQRQFKALLRAGDIDADMDEALAVRVMSSRVSPGVGEFEGIALPPKFKMALRRQSRR